MRTIMKKIVAISTATMMLITAGAIPAKGKENIGWELIYDINEQVVNPWGLGNDRVNGNGNDDGTNRVSSQESPWTATLLTADVIMTEPCLGMFVDVAVEGNTEYRVEYDLAGSFAGTENAGSPKGCYLNHSEWDTMIKTRYVNDMGLNQVLSLTDGGTTTQVQEFTTHESAEVLRLQFNLRRVGASETVTISNVKVYKSVQPDSGITSVDGAELQGSTIIVNAQDTVACFKGKVVAEPLDAEITVYKDETRGEILSDEERIEDGCVVEISAEGYTTSSYIIQFSAELVLQGLTAEFKQAFEAWAEKEKKNYSNITDNYTFPDIDMLESQVLSEAAVRYNLTLEWVSGNPDVISDTGILNGAISQDTDVVMTARLKKDDRYSEAETITIHVVGGSGSTLEQDTAVVDADIDALNDRMNLVKTVRKNIILPGQGNNGSTITWATSDSSALTADGVVTRSFEDKKVTLTATVTYRSVEKEVTYEITVLKAEGWTLDFDTDNLIANPWKNGNDKASGNGDDDGTNRVSSQEAPWTATLTVASVLTEEPCLGMYVDINVEPGMLYRVEYELEGSYKATASARTPKGCYVNHSEWDAGNSRVVNLTNLNPVEELSPGKNHRQTMEIVTSGNTAVLRLQFNLRRVGASETVTIRNVKVYKYKKPSSVITAVDGAQLQDGAIVVDELVSAATLKSMITTSPEDAEITVFRDENKNVALSDGDTIAEGCVVEISADDYVSSDYMIKISPKIVLQGLADEFKRAFAAWAQREKERYSNITDPYVFPDVAALESDVLTEAASRYNITVQWSSGNRNIIYDNGRLNGKIKEDVDVVMTARLKVEDQFSDPETITVHIKAGAGSVDNRDMEVVEADIKVLNEIMDRTKVTANNLSLLSRGENGSSITWETSDSAIITETGVITRSSVNKIAVLTATVSYGIASREVPYEITVLKTNQAAAGAVGGVGTIYPVVTSTGNSTDGSDSSPADSQIKFGTTGVNQINLEIPEGYTATYSINGGKQKTYKGKFDLPVGENQIAVVLFDEKGKIVEERSFTVKVDKPIAKKIKTVKKGKRFTMKITNKEAASRIVYKTTNKKVANVSKSGSIKAKSKGKAVIKAKLVIAGEVHIVKTKIKVK